MTPRRAVTFMIHRDGSLESRSYRVPIWLLRTGIIVAALLVVGVIVGAVLYTPIARTAASVPGLRRELGQLRAENAQVRELARTLTEMESRYAQVRAMLGGDVIPSPQDVGRIPVTEAMFATEPGAEPRYESGQSTPSHWPLQASGIVTRGQISPGADDETHPGIDIAVPMATPIKASGGGIVGQIGEDPEYGVFVLIDHPDGYQTLYGHASRLLVALGDSVAAGEVVALSGSTGRSTGPHLHFEIRRNGRSLDPRSIVTEGR